MPSNAAGGERFDERFPVQPAPGRAGHDESWVVAVGWYDRFEPGADTTPTPGSTISEICGPSAGLTKRRSL